MPVLVIFVPYSTNSYLYHVSQQKSFKGARNEALQFLNFLASVALVSYRSVCLKWKRGSSLHTSRQLKLFQFRTSQYTQYQYYSLVFSFILPAFLFCILALIEKNIFISYVMRKWNKNLNNFRLTFGVGLESWNQIIKSSNEWIAPINIGRLVDHLDHH